VGKIGVVAVATCAQSGIVSLLLRRPMHARTELQNLDIAIPWSDDQNSLSSIPQYHPPPGSTTKYRFHCRLSMTKKFPTGVLMDGIAISWSNYANLLSSIPQYHKNSDLPIDI